MNRTEAAQFLLASVEKSATDILDVAKPAIWANQKALGVLGVNKRRGYQAAGGLGSLAAAHATGGGVGESLASGAAAATSKGDFATQAGNVAGAGAAGGIMNTVGVTNPYLRIAGRYAATKAGGKLFNAGKDYLTGTY